MNTTQSAPRTHRILQLLVVATAALTGCAAQAPAAAPQHAGGKSAVVATAEPQTVAFDQVSFAQRFDLNAERPYESTPLLAKGQSLSLNPAAKLVPIPTATAPALVTLPAVSAPASRCPAEGTRVLLIGDSLSHGLGPVMARQAKACGTAFFHKGVVGSHVTQWAQDHWLKPQLKRANPSVVMVSLGGNDFQRTDPQNVREAIPRFIDKVQASGAELMWISPPEMPFRDTIDVRGMWHSSIEADGGVEVFAAEELTIPRGADKIHPTMQGNRDLSAKLWKWMSAHAE